MSETNDLFSGTNCLYVNFPTIKDNRLPTHHITSLTGLKRVLFKHVKNTNTIHDVSDISFQFNKKLLKTVVPYLENFCSKQLEEIKK